MNFADLEKTWRSPHNRPSPAEMESMKIQFIAEHDRRRRNLKRFLFLVTAVLGFLTLRFAVQAFRANAGTSDFNFSREWGAVVFLLLPWGAVAFLARRLSRHDRVHGNSASTLADSILMLLNENRMSRTRLKVMGWLYGATLLVLPLVVYQLRAVGKAGDEILLPAFVGWPLLAAGIFSIMWWYDRRKLRPRQEELAALLKSYE